MSEPAPDGDGHDDAEQNGHGRGCLGTISHTIMVETGIAVILRANYNVKLLMVQKFFRMFAYGGAVLILATYLAALGAPESKIGLFMSLTLAGDIVISLFLTMYADRIGRKIILAGGAACLVMSGLVFAYFDEFWILLLAAIFGVISPSGNEIGPFRAIEESIVAHLTPKPDLGSAYAWYTLLGQAGTAFGMLSCGWLSNTLQTRGWTFVEASKAIFVVYAAAGGMKLLLTLCMSRAVEAEPKKAKPRDEDETAPLLQEDDDNAQVERQVASPAPKKPFFTMSDSQRLLLALTVFFALDNFASGLITLSWLTYYIKDYFSVKDGVLGSIFFTTSIIAAASSLVAASLARRLGNIKTMAFTHLPSSIMLALIPFPSKLSWTLVFLIGRACTQQMDVAPRTAFLAMVLPPDQRTAIMGFLNVVKTCSSSIGPSITGRLAEARLFWVAFVGAGVCKALYDIGMLVTFVGRESRPIA